MRSDAELISASSLDPEAFRALYDRHASKIHGYLVRRTGDHEAALDLTAETFAQVWASRHQFKDQGDGTAGRWIFGIAHNVLSRSARERRLIREASDALRLIRPTSEAIPNDSWADGLNGGLDPDLESELEQALAELPETQRRAVELRVMHDQSYQTVAEQGDCSPTAARIRVSRGLATLRTSLAVSPRTDSR